MKIERLILGYIASNCYLISTNNSAIVIDPSKKADRIIKFLEENRDKKVYVLLTHRHFDHLGAVGFFKQNYDITVCIHALDEIGLKDTSASLSDRFMIRQIPCNADIILKDRDILKIGDLSVEVIHTPGHTSGGVCYKIGNSLFTGDTLFKQNAGRTDLESSGDKALRESLKKLAMLDGNFDVYPGHGDATTLDDERKYNPYVLSVL